MVVTFVYLFTCFYSCTYWFLSRSNRMIRKLIDRFLAPSITDSSYPPPSQLRWALFLSSSRVNRIRFPFER